MDPDGTSAAASPCSMEGSEPTPAAPLEKVPSAPAAARSEASLAPGAAKSMPPPARAPTERLETPDLGHVAPWMQAPASGTGPAALKAKRSKGGALSAPPPRGTAVVHVADGMEANPGGASWPAACRPAEARDVEAPVPEVPLAPARIPLVSRIVAMPLGLCLVVSGSLILAAGIMYKVPVFEAHFFASGVTEFSTFVNGTDLAHHKGFQLLIAETESCRETYIGTEFYGELVAYVEPNVVKLCDVAVQDLGTSDHDPPLITLAQFSWVHIDGDYMNVPEPSLLTVSTPVPMWVVALPDGVEIVEVSTPASAAMIAVAVLAFCCAIACCLAPLCNVKAPPAKE